MTAQLRESYTGLERKVEERTAELTETLDQQTATSEILKSSAARRPTCSRCSRRSSKARPSCSRRHVRRAFLRDGELCIWLAIAGATVDARRREEMPAFIQCRSIPGHARSARAMAERRPVACADRRRRTSRSSQAGRRAGLPQEPRRAAAPRRRGHRHDRRCWHDPGSRWARSSSPAADLRRPGGDRDRERAPVQRDQGVARAADRDRGDSQGHQQLDRPTCSRCSTRSCAARSAFATRWSPASCCSTARSASAGATAHRRHSGRR